MTSSTDDKFFIRSANGLTNYNIFSRKEITVFIEGACKDKLSVKECFSNDYNNAHGYNDKLFWNSFFIRFCQKKSYEIRVVGSKSFLKKIFDEISLLGKFPNSVIICVDRDNKFKNDFPQHKSIFSTYGYSWENEVWNKDNVQEVICSLLPLSRSEQKELKCNITSWYDEFLSVLDRFIFLDIIFTYNNDGLFFRDNHVGHNIIIDDTSKSVLIDKDRLRSHWREKHSLRDARLQRIRSDNIEKYWDCYGHLVDLFFKHKVRFLGDRYSCHNFAPKAILPLLISNFWTKRHQKKNVFILKHYINQMQRFCMESCRSCPEKT